MPPRPGRNSFVKVAGFKAICIGNPSQTPHTSPISFACIFTSFVQSSPNFTHSTADHCAIFQSGRISERDVINFWTNQFLRDLSLYDGFGTDYLYCDEPISPREGQFPQKRGGGPSKGVTVLRTKRFACQWAAKRRMPHSAFHENVK